MHLEFYVTILCVGVVIDDMWLRHRRKTYEYRDVNQMSQGNMFNIHDIYIYKQINERVYAYRQHIIGCTHPF